MNLRPIETMGLAQVLQFLGFPVAGVHWLPERMPFDPRGWDYRLPRIPKSNLMFADPLAVYWAIDPFGAEMTRRERRQAERKMPAGAWIVVVQVPMGELLTDGFMGQRILVWADAANRDLKVSPQGPPTTTQGKVVEGILVGRRDGPAGMAGDLRMEVPHAITGVLELLRRAGGAL